MVVIKKILLPTLLFLQLITTNSAFATLVSGRVTIEQGATPVQFANVFLANTTFGTITQVDGSFTLVVNKPGTYLLTVSHMSYQTYFLEINVGFTDIKGLSVVLKEKTRELDAVKISAKDSFRKENMELFVSKFLGNTRNSDKCQIRNPNAIRFFKNIKKGYVKAFADSMIVIENRSLGYLIRYKLDYFYVDGKETVFYGTPLFEDNLQNISNKKKVLERRRQAYLGSMQHFIHSLYTDSMGQQGFRACKIEEKPQDNNNLAYGLLSSFAFVSKRGNHLVQLKDTVNISSYLSADSAHRFKRLKYTNPFRIVYLKSEEEFRYRNDRQYWNIERKRNQQATLIKVLTGDGLKFFENGAWSISDVVVCGYMGYKGSLSDVLPYNYDLREGVGME